MESKATRATERQETPTREVSPRLRQLEVSLKALVQRKMGWLPLGLGAYLLSLPLLRLAVAQLEGLMVPGSGVLGFIGTMVYVWGSAVAVAAHQEEMLSRPVAPLLHGQGSSVRAASLVWLFGVCFLPSPLLWYLWFSADPDFANLPSSAGALAGGVAVALGYWTGVTGARRLIMMWIPLVILIVAMPRGTLAGLKGLPWPEIWLGGGALLLLLAGVWLPGSQSERGPFLDDESDEVQDWFGPRFRFVLDFILTTHARALERLTPPGAQHEEGPSFMTDVRLHRLGTPELRLPLSVLLGALLLFMLHKTSSEASAFVASQENRDKVLLLLVAAATLVGGQVSGSLSSLEERKWLGLAMLRPASRGRFMAASLCAFVWKALSQGVTTVLLPVMAWGYVTGQPATAWRLSEYAAAFLPLILGLARLEGLEAQRSTGMGKGVIALGYAAVLVLSAVFFVEAPPFPQELLSLWLVAGAFTWGIVIVRFRQLEPA